ncbi:MAG TPA: hypothetical protein VFU47_08755 [Armatimonadota bacterium]|nr:hypothetical protein [Armatimonadota bacterium]
MTPKPLRQDGESPRSSLAGWFTHPPYPGLWLSGSAALLVLAAALLASTSRPPRTRIAAIRESTPLPVVDVASAPGRSALAPGQNAPAAEVSVRTLPPPAPHNAPGNAPAANAPVPGNGPAAQPSALPANSPVTLPAPPVQPDLAPEEPAPSVESVPPAPEERPAPAPITPPVRPEPAPEPPRVRRPAPVFVPRRTGRMTLYFDADSSTFDHRGDRLPLRVEVYVDGVKRLETSDPEKRLFGIGPLSDGEHDIQIVPYIDDYPADPRRETVRIRAGQINDFKAVLRRSHGMSRISKFEERD